MLHFTCWSDSGSYTSLNTYRKLKPQEISATKAAEGGGKVSRCFDVVVAAHSRKLNTKAGREKSERWKFSSFSRENFVVRLSSAEFTNLQIHVVSHTPHTYTRANSPPLGWKPTTGLERDVKLKCARNCDRKLSSDILLMLKTKSASGGNLRMVEKRRKNNEHERMWNMWSHFEIMYEEMTKKGEREKIKEKRTKRMWGFCVSGMCVCKWNEMMIWETNREKKATTEQWVENTNRKTKVVMPSSENKTAGGEYLSFTPQSSAPL